jgi:hypothetical protein
VSATTTTTFSVACPFCPERVELHPAGPILYGIITPLDVACAEVTVTGPGTEHVAQHVRAAHAGPGTDRDRLRQILTARRDQAASMLAHYDKSEAAEAKEAGQ